MSDLIVFQGHCKDWVRIMLPHLTHMLDKMESTYSSEHARWFIAIARAELWEATKNGRHAHLRENIEDEYDQLVKDPEFDEIRENFCRDCAGCLAEHLCKSYGCKMKRGHSCPRHFELATAWWVDGNVETILHKK